MPVPAGARLGPYEVLALIGAGGMGEVYKARDTRLGRTVAIKILPPELDSDPERRRRFEREARTISQLTHPHICALHDVGEAELPSAEKVQFLVMEYLEGETLAAWLTRVGAAPASPLRLDEALRFGAEIADALASAHAQGIVHRDLKPANIMLVRSGGGAGPPAVKLLDFGLAKARADAERPAVGDSRTTTTDMVTEAGRVLGTVPYMAPEQVAGQGADARSDIFALGCVLYEMVTGRRAFDGPSAAAVMSAILRDDPPPVVDRQPLAPPPLDRLVRTCLAKDPGARWQSAADVKRELLWIAAPTATARRRPARRAALVAGVAAAALVAGLAGVVGLNVGGLRDRLVRPAAALPIRSVAVLPLANLSGDPAQEYFADGMTEELITDLAKISALKVISRTSVMQYKGTTKPLPQIARELNVDALIEGSVLREGGQVRITAQLIQASTDQHLWAESYQRDLRGVLALQGEIASAIADQVRVAVTPSERARLAGARPVNPVAYEAYLKGMQSCYRVTPQDTDTALEYFELALEKDQGFAAAYAGISFVWLLRNQAGWTPPREGGPKAKAAALKAIELDTTLGEGHAQLASVKFLYEWDWAGAEAEYKRAIELNPNFADALSAYSHYLMIMNRPEEAMAQMQRALDLDPLNGLIQVHHGFLLESAGRYDEAIVEWRNLLRTSPQNVIAHGRLSYDLFRKAKYEESLAEMKAYYAGDREMEEALSQAYAQSGYRRAMTRAADLLAARGRTTYTIPNDVAALYAMAGEEGQALDWLEKGFEARDPNLPYLNLYPEFEPLRSTPRFQALLRRMNLPQ